MNKALQEEIVTASIPISASAWKTPARDSSTYTLLLHGYGQTAQQFYEQIKDYLLNQEICLLQAPFPVPVKKALVGYSWYAYDASTNTFPIPMSTAALFARQAMDQLQLSARIDRVIGFSQGGYLAPLVAQALPDVKQVIGINARFRDEELLGQTISFQLDAINGEQDTIVDPYQARASHQKLVARGVQGRFHLVAQSRHAIDDRLGRALIEMTKA